MSGDTAASGRARTRLSEPTTADKLTFRTSRAGYRVN